MSIKIRTKTITPNMAQDMLNRSESIGIVNRKPSQNYIDLYAREMKEGRWKLNGVAIKIDENGGILDGQHRLQACVASGIPFQSIVMYGVPRDTFDTLDCGRSRTASQVLKMKGIKYNQAIATIIYGVTDLREIGHTANHEKRLSNSAALEEYNRNSAHYDRAATVAATAVAETHAMTAKLAGCIFYYLVHDLKQNADFVERFIRESTSFDSSPDPVIDHFRKWNLANRMIKMSDRNRIGYAALTWNALVAGSKKVPRFSDKSIDPMPTFNKK